jgi:hypothetical protein
MLLGYASIFTLCWLLGFHCHDIDCLPKLVTTSVSIISSDDVACPIRAQVEQAELLNISTAAPFQLVSEEYSRGSECTC